jgi:hypothetical protein
MDTAASRAAVGTQPHERRQPVLTVLQPSAAGSEGPGSHADAIGEPALRALVADELVLTKRAVEKHINAIFLKLGLTWATDVSRRVKAALIYRAESDEG